MNIVKSDINRWRVYLTFIFSLLIIGIVVFPIKLHAAITNPYVVDEKPQVQFGDTVTIIDGEKTYFGLENYLN